MKKDCFGNRHFARTFVRAGPLNLHPIEGTSHPPCIQFAHCWSHVTPIGKRCAWNIKWCQNNRVPHKYYWIFTLSTNYSRFPSVGAHGAVLVNWRASEKWASWCRQDSPLHPGTWNGKRPLEECNTFNFRPLICSLWRVRCPTGIPVCLDLIKSEILEHEARPMGDRRMSRNRGPDDRGFVRNQSIGITCNKTAYTNYTESVVSWRTMDLWWFAQLA